MCPSIRSSQKNGCKFYTLSFINLWKHTGADRHPKLGVDSTLEDVHSTNAPPKLGAMSAGRVSSPGDSSRDLFIP